MYADLQSSEPRTQFFYVTAERLSNSKKLLDTLASLHKRRLLRLLVIDEVRDRDTQTKRIKIRIYRDIERDI